MNNSILIPILAYRHHNKSTELIKWSSGETLFISVMIFIAISILVFSTVMVIKELRK
jgi:hypothetical protein